MTIRRTLLTESVHVAVEQAIAMGRSTEWICRQLGVTQFDVAWVRAYLDELNDTPTEGRGKAVSSEQCETIAREETARIYRETVPEHHGNAAPQPQWVTDWERGRLNSAARKLTTPRPRKETA